MGAYAQVGQALVRRGYAAIPIIPGSKTPGFLRGRTWVKLTGWSHKFISGPPTKLEQELWSAGDTGVGVVAGPSSHGLVAVDIDTDDAEIKAALIGVLPPTPVRKRGAKGETLFYHGSSISESRSWNVNNRRVIDLIGPGRQTVLPPSIHPATGAPYVWLGRETLERWAPDQLPELAAPAVDWITQALVPFGYEVPEEISPGDSDTPHRQLNEAALARLEVWVPALRLYRCRRTRRGFEAVPMWRPSSTGRPLEKRKLNLKIVPQGIRDFGTGQGYTPLDLAIAALNCDLDTAWKFLTDRLGWNEDTIEIGSSLDCEPAPKANEPPPSPDKALEPFTRVPGLVGDIIEWIVATARRPNRVLALGAAIPLVGTLIGRRVAGPTRSATHLYVVSVAPTGSGKQHLIDATTRLMKAAGAQGHIGPGEFISMPAVVNFLLRKPLALCLQDEYGAFLQRITAKKASGFEIAISKILRTLWGTSFSAMATAEWASREMKIVHSPAISIFGLSTPDEFHAALQGESVANGFLNRLLVLTSELRTPDREPQDDPGILPPSLANSLRQLYLWSGPTSILQIDNPEIAFEPDVLSWASQQAQDVYREFEHIRERAMDDDPDIRPYVARAGEMAIRLATIRAAGRWGPSAQIDLSDMEWAAGLAWTAGQGLATSAMKYLPQNERSDYTSKILMLIRRRRGIIKSRDIQQYLRGRLRSTEIKDILAQLIEAGEIERAADGYRRIHS